MNIKQILYEGRVDDFKSKYTQKFGADKIERITSLVLPKYLDWVGKHMDSVNFDETFHKLTGALEKFNKIYSNLPKTNIEEYRNIDELINAITEYSQKERRTYQQVQGGNLVYEDNRFYVVNPLTHEASCYYGKGTKWCTAAQSDGHFNTYNQDGKLFYVLDKTLPTSDSYYKVAILKKFDGNESYWDATDEQIIQGWILGTKELDKINKEINNYFNVHFAEQIKIFSDKEAAKKEKERLERLRIQQIHRQNEELAEERRLDGEWELGPDCPDEGLKAHALLEWLVDTSDVSVLTNEDRIEIQRIEDEIERLQAEYDADEETRTDLLDEISDLEDELNELKEKIDVYNIIPTGTHYDLTTFEVINGGLDNREYAVGDEDETRSSAYDYVEQLIDDIGYEGFSESFATSHIDSEYLKDYARDIYSDMIYNDPESYFDDSERQLSTEQNEKIKILKYKIERSESSIEDLETKQNEDDEEFFDEYEEKIEELREMIQEMTDEITEIEEDPDGDFPDDLIEEKIDDMAEDAIKDEMGFIKEWELEISRFINKDDFINDVIDTDGYGNTLSTYDGNADEVYVDNVLYYVIRIN